MKYNIGSAVRLKSFFGTTVAEQGTATSENYWKLIGICGVVIQKRDKPHPAYPDKGLQYLIQFNADIQEFNLTIHNEIKNSILFFESDLELCD